MTVPPAVRKALWFLQPLHESWSSHLHRSDELAEELDTLVADLQRTTLDLRKHAKKYRNELTEMQEGTP